MAPITVPTGLRELHSFVLREGRNCVRVDATPFPHLSCAGLRVKFWVFQRGKLRTLREHGVVLFSVFMKDCIKHFYKHVLDQ